MFNYLFKLCLIMDNHHELQGFESEFFQDSFWNEHRTELDADYNTALPEPDQFLLPSSEHIVPEAGSSVSNVGQLDGVIKYLDHANETQEGSSTTTTYEPSGDTVQTINPRRLQTVGELQLEMAELRLT